MELVLPGKIVTFDDLTKGDLFLFHFLGAPVLATKAFRAISPGEEWQGCVVISSCPGQETPRTADRDIVLLSAVMQITEARLVACAVPASVAASTGGKLVAGELALFKSGAFLVVNYGVDISYLALDSGKLTADCPKDLRIVISKWSIERGPEDRPEVLYRFPVPD